MTCLSKIDMGMYRQTSNISCTLLGNKIVDHSDVLEASPVGAAPTTSSFSTYHLLSMDSIIEIIRYMLFHVRDTWAPFQYEDHLTRYGSSHYKGKTVMRLSYLYNGNSYTGKMAYLYWNGPLLLTYTVNKISQSKDI